MKFRNWKPRTRNFFSVRDKLEIRSSREAGITLLLVALLLSAILSISVGIFAIVFGQIQISGELADSFHALNAADRAVEKILFLDRIEGECEDPNDCDENNTGQSSPLSPQLGCYEVVLEKAPTPNCGGDLDTCITVAGQYQCGAESTRNVRRGFSVTY